MKIQKKIEVQLQRKALLRPVDLVQYDTGIQLVFTIMDFDVPAGTTAMLYVQKKSGKFVYQETGITVSGNVITIDLENQALAECGEAGYQVRLKNGTDVISTFAGIMRVEKTLANTNAEESKSVIAGLDTVILDKVATVMENYLNKISVKGTLLVTATLSSTATSHSATEIRAAFESGRSVLFFLTDGEIVVPLTGFDYDGAALFEATLFQSFSKGRELGCTVVRVDDNKTYTMEDTNYAGVPVVTKTEEGMFLRAVGGKAAWVTIPNAEEASF